MKTATGTRLGHTRGSPSHRRTSRRTRRRNRRLLIITAAWTGRRWGELIGLHRDDLGLDRTDDVVDRPSDLGDLFAPVEQDCAPLPD